MAAHKIVLVGLGNMGKNHLRVLSENTDFDIVAVVDPAVTQLPKPYNDLRVLDSIEKTLELDFEAAVIASPTETHFDIAKFFISNGKKLLVEKPLAHSSEKAQELSAFAKEKGLLLGVGHVERANPAVRKLQEVINNGWLGKPIHLNFTRVGGFPENVKKGNNVLLDLAIHDLDILDFLQGGFGVRASICHKSMLGDIADTAEILLANDNGVSANIHVNWITPTKIRTLRVTGTKGVCFVDYMLQTCTLFGGNLLQNTVKDQFDYKDLQLHYRNSDKIEFGVAQEEPLKVQLREFDKALRQEDSKLCLADQGARMVELAESAIESGKG